MIIKNNDNIKIVSTKDYKYMFNKKNGNFIRYGKTLKDNPQYSKVGPEILDIEVTTKCFGPRGKLCKFCYKGNTPNGKNMSLNTFKNIIDKMLPTLNMLNVSSDKLHFT